MAKTPTQGRKNVKYLYHLRKIQELPLLKDG